MGGAGVTPPRAGAPPPRKKRTARRRATIRPTVGRRRRPPQLVDHVRVRRRSLSTATPRRAIYYCSDRVTAVVSRARVLRRGSDSKPFRS